MTNHISYNERLSQVEVKKGNNKEEWGNIMEKKKNIF